MPTADELIVQALEEAGVEYVFGIPGGGTGQIFNLLYDKQDRIRTVLVRHEQVAAIMADAYGRATGKPAAIMGQGLFMGSNAAFGIMEAMLSSSPMLVLTDTSDGGVAFHAANQSGAGEYGSIDLPTIFKAMTKYTTLATNPKEAVLGTQLAIKHATSGRPGPAAVVMRSAAISGDVDVESPPFVHPTAGYLNTAKPQSAPQDIQRAVELLSQSQRPVMVAGNGVHLSKSHDQLRELAEIWNMPVATSYKGKSAIEETHPLALGMVGVYGQDTANRVVGDADTVLVVGAKLTPQDTVRERPNVFDPRRQKIIQIDIEDRNAGWTFPLELGLIGDAGSILSQLVEASRQPASDSGPARERWAQDLPQRKADLAFYSDPEMQRDSSPVTPQRLVAILEETLPKDTIFSLDAGNNRTWMAHFYQARQANTFFCPGGTAGMGWGLPASVALKLVYPGPSGGLRHRRRRLHDDRQRPVNRRSVRPADYMRGLQRRRSRHGEAPPAPRPLHRFRVRDYRQRRRGPWVRRFRRPGRRLAGPSRRHPAGPSVWTPCGNRRSHRPGPQPRRLAGRRPQGRGNIGIGLEE